MFPKESPNRNLVALALSYWMNMNNAGSAVNAGNAGNGSDGGNGTLVGRGSRTIYSQSADPTLTYLTPLLGRKSRRAVVLRRAAARRVSRPNDILQRRYITLPCGNSRVFR